MINRVESRSSNPCVNHAAHASFGFQIIHVGMMDGIPLTTHQSEIREHSRFFIDIKVNKEAILEPSFNDLSMFHWRTNQRWKKVKRKMIEEKR